ncbi:hypothetical protein [Chlamydiifrater volucris]|uniref:hypothetical protein n=1 Tax=Chlamydiifrater volucris TaxID=2681470 RepID=UPI001BCBE1A3|nr:hypothetical protein [Chlamydiifrater volucris]
MKLFCKNVMTRLGCKDVGLGHVSRMRPGVCVDRVRAAIVGIVFFLGVTSLLSGGACFRGAVSGGALVVSGAICIALGIVLLALSIAWIVKMSGISICSCLGGKK